MSEQPVERQRVGAYVLCLREGHILLTRLSDRTGRPGAWTLPGGGVEHGEHPRTAATREAMEETALKVTLGGVLTVDSNRFVGRSPDGVLEDYHAIRIIYAGKTEDRGTPRVLDVGGSSDAAAWAPLDDLSGFPVVEMVTKALSAAGFRLE